MALVGPVIRSSLLGYDICNECIYSIHAAAENGHLNCLKSWICINQGQGSKSGSVYGDTILHLASENGHLEVAQFILQNVLNINVKNNEGQTPLHIAAVNNQIQMVYLLLENDANIEIKDRKGLTALQWAIHYHHTLVQMILEQARYFKYNICNLCTNDPRLPIYNNHTTCVKAYILKGFELESKHADDFGTLLHLASAKGCAEIVNVLLNEGALVDTTDAEGKTPLLLAIESKKPEVVEILIEKGASFKPPYSNETPLTFAFRKFYVPPVPLSGSAFGQIVGILVTKDFFDGNFSNPALVLWSSYSEDILSSIQKKLDFNMNNFNVLQTCVSNKVVHEHIREPLYKLIKRNKEAQLHWMNLPIR
eukprot:Pgem_evm1s5508